MMLPLYDSFVVVMQVMQSILLQVRIDVGTVSASYLATRVVTLNTTNMKIIHIMSIHVPASANLLVYSIPLRTS